MITDVRKDLWHVLNELLPSVDSIVRKNQNAESEVDVRSDQTECTFQIVGSQKIDHDSESYSEVAGVGRATYSTVKEFEMIIEIEGTGSMDLMDSLRDSLNTEKGREICESRNLVFVRIDLDIQDLTNLHGSRFVERARIDITMRRSEEYISEVGLIESVDIGYEYLNGVQEHSGTIPVAT